MLGTTEGALLRSACCGDPGRPPRGGKLPLSCCWTGGRWEGWAGLWGEAPRMRRRAAVRAPGLSLPLSLCPASVRTPEGRGLSESFLGP